ncbi:MAG TPA: HDIG domain-containing protein [Fimbriimonadaceae bacterium]
MNERYSPTQMHHALAALAGSTKSTPYEGHLWLVGGAVRDKLLGKSEPTDFDVVTEMDAITLAHNLWEREVSDIFPVIYPRFGTAMVRIGGAQIELITARRESYEDDSRKPDVEPATLEDDARRRDFTVNTLLENIHTEELRDPLGTGLQDLKDKLLRTPLNPRATFYEDPLRMLRAIRFKQQLGFELVPGIEDAVVAQSDRLSIISEERIRDEWVKMLLLPGASESMRDLLKLDLLPLFAPEFEDMVGVEQGSYHHLDVWDHTLLVLDNIGPGNLTLSLGALLHDVGKPQTRFVDDEGNTRFFGHEGLGAQIAYRMLQRLKFSNEQIAPVVLLVRNHMRLGSMHEFTASAARRLIRDMDGEVEDLLQLVEADTLALRPGLKTLELAPIRERLAEVKQVTPRSSLESPLSGEEIMELTGLEPGPEVGRLKSILLDRVLEGELVPGDKEGAEKLVRSVHKQL